MHRPKPNRQCDRAAFRGTVALCRQRTPQIVTPENISSGGIFVRAGDSTLKQLVTLRINLPGEAGFTVLGRVAWMREGNVPGVGIEFLDVMPSQRSRIDRYVDGARGGVAVENGQIAAWY